MTDAVPYSTAEVKALIVEMRLYAINLSVAQAWQLLRHVGDRKLVVDALLMPKRPVWLEEMVGPKVVVPKELPKPKGKK